MASTATQRGPAYGERELIDMIDRLLVGAWTVEEFRREYYDFWLDGVPRGVLSDDEEEFFSDVQERLDWTTLSPTESAKQYGWLTHEEYVDWVKLRRIGFEG
jgi:hypothetical protein